MSSPISMGSRKTTTFLCGWYPSRVCSINSTCGRRQNALPSRAVGGDKVEFFKEFQKYLANWQFQETDDQGNAVGRKGREGETGLDPNPVTALQKKHIFNDFLNYSTKETAEVTRIGTRIPRIKGERKLAPSDPRGRPYDNDDEAGPRY